MLIYFDKNKINNGTDTEKVQGNLHYLITSIENQRDNEEKNVSTINLEECKDKLKKESKYKR
mgnify:FL=1